MDPTSDLSAVLKPIEDARGLPNEHYVDPGIFEEEKKAVLYANWAGIGFAKDIPEPGDVMPVTFIDLPLLMIRDQNGEIGVFQNTCRHRGMVLVDRPMQTNGPIRCPYHSWCYSLNGELKATPHIGGAGEHAHEAVPRSAYGLIKVDTYVWHDVVFVNVDGKAGPFEDRNRDLMDRWREFSQPLHHCGEESSFSLRVATNWKLAAENFCESYHLPTIHPELNKISRLEDHYNILAHGQYSGQGSLVYQQLKGDDGQSFPDFKKLSEKWNHGAEYVTLYPNVLLGVHRDHCYGVILEPVSTAETIEHVALYYADKTVQGTQYSNLRKSNARLWRDIFEEDIYVVEGMQRGRKGSLFDGGKFSPVMDKPTHNFHHWIATQMQKRRSVQHAAGPA